MSVRYSEDFKKEVVKANMAGVNTSTCCCFIKQRLYQYRLSNKHT